MIEKHTATDFEELYDDDLADDEPDFDDDNEVFDPKWAEEEPNEKFPLAAANKKQLPATKTSHSRELAVVPKGNIESYIHLAYEQPMLTAEEEKSLAERV